jgi:YHS domain-containing protein
MIDLHLTATAVGPDGVAAGYRCPCGCTPAATLRRGDLVATEGCCCGNEFAVGPAAADHVHAGEGYEIRTGSLVAPWGEHVPVVWAIGPSTHDEGGHDADAHHDHDLRDRHDGTAHDPVCGMTVELATAQAKGLSSRHRDVDYVFCGKGCKLEFDDDPERYLDAAYVPSM